MSSPIGQFQQIVWDYYRHHGRDLPWRQPSCTPYAILVSELMLQQTQVQRVVPKYQQFLGVFSDVESLAAAQFQDVLAVWNGLGYNRRAKYLLEAARQIVNRYNGLLPDDPEQLEQLPGVGPNTAAAIVAYAFNRPVVFIETNIRSVFIHHFFEDAELIHDRQLLPLIKQSLDQEHPREWYWALMDYGSHLKSAGSNPSRSSSHYKKQSRFEGSRRQLRAQVLRRLLADPQSLSALANTLSDDRLSSVLSDLQAEGLITKRNNLFMLS